MSIDLDKLQEMWERDAKIDRDNLHEESLSVPSLHAKYFELYKSDIILLPTNEICLFCRFLISLGTVSYTHLTLPTTD